MRIDNLSTRISRTALSGSRTSLIHKACTTGLLGVAIASAPLMATAQDAEHTLTLGYLSVSGSYYSENVERIPDIVAEATDGRVEIDLNTSILGATQLASGVRSARVPMSAAVQTYLAGDDPRMGLFNLPGLIQGMAEYKFVGDAFWFDDLAELWENEWNSIVLANGAWCPNKLWTNEPIETVEDFQGKTLRVHNPQMAAFVRELGASPTAMAMAELMPALERGVIDGVFTSWCVGWEQEYWRVANHAQNWGFADVTGWAIIINKDEWESLPEDLRDSIGAVMKEFEQDVLHGYNEFAANARQAMIDSDDVIVIEIDEAERARIFEPEYTDAVYEAWYERAEQRGFDGREYVERVRTLLLK